MNFFKVMLAVMAGTFITIVILFLISLGIIAGIISASSDADVVVPPKSVLYLKLDEPVTERSPKMPFIMPFDGRSAGLDDILKNIRKAADDPNIKGIYLDAEAIPAGLSTIIEIREALEQFKSSGKFIYAYGNFFTQSSYYLSSVADSLYLNPEGLILFHGLNAELMFLKGTLEKLDVKVQIIRHGKFKAATEPLFLDKMSPENREQITLLLNSLWDQMVEDISESRSLSKESLGQIAGALKLNAPEDAVSMRMADRLLYKDEFLGVLRKTLELDSAAKISMIALSDYINAKDKNRTVSPQKIAVVYATGDVVDGEGDENNTGGERISRAIRKARLDKKVKAIVLRVNSPGGSALASEVILREVELARKEKPVVASFGDVAASGGYYIACAADKIIAGPTTITGSIGVWAAIPNLQGLFNDKLGITFDNVQTNENSDFIPVTKPLPPSQTVYLQNMVDRTYSVFANHVAKFRKMSYEQVDSIGQGRVWSGIDALRLGLVDSLGGIETAIATAASLAKITDYRLMALPVQKDPIDQIIEELTGKSNPEVYMKQLLGEEYHVFKTLKSIKESSGIQARMLTDIKIE
jgi:protease-4